MKIEHIEKKIPNPDKCTTTKLLLMILINLKYDI